ncbi:hypothetical protein BV22DRAFT_987935, partial [Leucogyrophana mollusca]
IFDSGSAICCMSKSVARRVGIRWDTTRRVLIRGAHDELVYTVGLATNVPLTIHGHIFILQVYVTETTAYDVLLGMPFNIYACMQSESNEKGHHLVCLHDPDT